MQLSPTIDLNEKIISWLLSAQFCAHPNVQQLLASIWYEGLPGFRRKNIVLQMMEILRIGLLFPIYSVAYIMAPHSQLGRTLRKPFIKFICHSASYISFLCEYSNMWLCCRLAAPSSDSSKAHEERVKSNVFLLFPSSAYTRFTTDRDSYGRVVWY